MPPKSSIPFDGFFPPEANYSKLPHQFIALMQHIDTLAEMKVIIYILRHTWGYHSFDGKPRRMTLDEFENGVKDRHGKRVDEGCGLKQNAVRKGLARAKEHGFILHEQDDSDKARVKNSYALVMTSVIQGDLVDYPATSSVESRVIQQITQSNPVDTSGRLTGSLDQKKTENQDNQKQEKESEPRTHARTRTIAIAVDKRFHLHRKAKPELIDLESKSGGESPSEVQSAPIPVPSPLPPQETSGTQVSTISAERRCQKCDRQRPRSAFFRVGWRNKTAREDQLEDWCALCRADEKHMPADDLPEYRRRLEEAAKERLARDAASVTPAPDAVEVSPLWLAYKAAWEKLTSDILTVPAQERDRYQKAVDELNQRKITPERIEAAVHALINKERYDYKFWYLPSDIHQYGVRRKTVTISQSPIASPERRAVANLLPELAPDDFYPPVIWRSTDPERVRQAMWQDIRTRGAAHEPMTRTESRAIAGQPAEEGVA